MPTLQGGMTPPRTIIVDVVLTVCGLVFTGGLLIRMLIRMPS